MRRRGSVVSVVSMARPARLSALPPEGVYHVTCRGVARCAISADDLDRRRWVSLLRATVTTREWQCFAWCLMPNHFHLVVLTELELLSRGMHGLNFRYAQKFNTRHERVGHLFQDRFHAREVADDRQLARTCDYVLANAVRAELCPTRDDWPWLGGLYA
jgi:putative transposase